MHYKYISHLQIIKRYTNLCEDLSESSTWVSKKGGGVKGEPSSVIFSGKIDMHSVRIEN